MMVWVLTALLLSLSLFSDSGWTAPVDDSYTLTSGQQTLSVAAVTFLDPLGYTKPRFYSVTVPNETTAPKWYVNFTSGSGTNCTQGSPCGSLSSVVGKAGTTGGPAYIYVKGSGGQMNWPNIYGSAGNEVVVKTWPGDSTPATWRAAGGCNISNANTINSGSYVIFDGGPNQLITFEGSACTGNQNGYTLTVNAQNITLWRVGVNARASGGPALGWATGTATNVDGFRFINSELYAATNYYGIYAGGGASCPGIPATKFTNVEIRNSVFRDVQGRGVQLEPRGTGSDNVIIDGNVFHNVGKGIGGGYGISAAVQPASACGPSVTNVKVSNNLGWDLGGGFVHSNGDHAGLVMYNNSVWDYGKGSPAATQSRAFSCYSSGCPGVARNNIVMTGNGWDAFHSNTSSWTKSNNVADTNGNIAGTVSNSYVNVNTSSGSFMFPAGPALGACSLQTGYATDYLGRTRTPDCDVGAIEQ